MAEKSSVPNEPRKLYKSRKDKIIDGVCAGFAEYFGIDVTIIRVLWLASLLAGGLGFWAYVAAMLLVPKNPAHKKLEDTQKAKHHPGMIGGALLIILGVLLLSDRWDIFQPWHFPHRFMRWGGPFWSFGDLFPYLIVAAGIAYLVYALKHKSTEENSEAAAIAVSSEDDHNTRLRRSISERWLGGVLGGIALHFHVDPVIVRLAFIAAALVTHPVFFALVYVGLWAAVPEEQL